MYIQKSRQKGLTILLLVCYGNAVVSLLVLVGILCAWNVLGIRIGSKFPEIIGLRLRFRLVCRKFQALKS